MSSHVRTGTSIVVGCSMLVLGVMSSASAGDDEGARFGDPEEDSALVQDSEETDTSEPAGGGDEPVYTVPEPYLQYAYVPNCSPNSAPTNEDAGDVVIEGADVMCTQAASSCPDDSETSFRAYARQMTADGEVDPDDGDWESDGVTCRGPDDPPEGGPPVITTQMVVDAARAVAPKPQVNVQPGERSYVNVPTNVYASDDVVTETVEVLGQSIAVRFAPASFRWSFGDGGSATGAGVRDAAPGAAGAVEHQYRRSGDYGITLSRSYDVTAELPNGETLELPTQLSNTSDPYGLDVGEIQSVVTDVD